MQGSVLVVEDDFGIQEYLKELLSDNGYLVHTASTGSEGLQLVEHTLPDLAVIDLGLPDISGESVCQNIRKKHPSVRVIILSARQSTNDIVTGLTIGADDYIAKPFVADELLARINARLRYGRAQDPSLEIDDLRIDVDSTRVVRGEKTLVLSPIEFKLLHYLVTNKGRVLTREMILNRVWMDNLEVETRVVDVYIGYLRKKVDQGVEKKLIQSVRGFGYMVRG